MPRKPATKTSADEAKSARTRQRILDAAAHVLSRKGYAGTRLTDVAEQAEIQAPAIYYYFPSREDLIEEVMWSGIAHICAHVQEQLDALPPETAALDRIDTAVEAHLRYQLEISDYTTAAIRNAGQIPEHLAVRYSAEVSKYGDLWRLLFQDAESDGVFRPDIDLRAARMLVLGALNWAAEWWNPRRGTLDIVVRTAKTIIRSGLTVETEAEDIRPASRRAKPRKTTRAAG